MKSSIYLNFTHFIEELMLGKKKKKKENLTKTVKLFPYTDKRELHS